MNQHNTDQFNSHHIFTLLQFLDFVWFVKCFQSRTITYHEKSLCMPWYYCQSQQTPDQQQRDNYLNQRRDEEAHLEYVWYCNTKMYCPICFPPFRANKIVPQLYQAQIKRIWMDTRMNAASDSITHCDIWFTVLIHTVRRHFEVCF